MKVLIGVAWPYAAGPRHVGHLAGAYLPADVAARYHRLAGDDVLSVSGTDEHGTPITVAAERAGVSPARFAAEQHDAIARSFARAGIGFDLFTRTTTATHEQVVQRLFRRLHASGLVEERPQLSAWCEAEGRSLPDRYVEGTCPRCDVPGARGDQCEACGTTLDPEELLDARCRRCGADATTRPLRQLFLRLDRLQPQVERHVARVSERWRPWVARESEGVLASGLRPRAITRDLDWGVRIPLEGWEDRRLYVWFDAVCGYLAASAEWAERRGEPDAHLAWWHDPDALHRYFVGKDNVWFHAIWWPAILLGTGDGWHLPDEVVASQYLVVDGAKASTSRGVGWTIDEALDRFGVDPLRHAICALSPEAADTELTAAQVEELTRSGLLGEIANPAHRVATLLWRRFEGVPAAGSTHGRDVEHARELLDDVGRALRGARYRDAVARLHAIGRTVNRRLAATEPWKLADPEAHAELSSLVPYLDALAIAAWPIVPTTAERIRATFGRPAEPAAWALPVDLARITAPPQPPLEGVAVRGGHTR